MSRWRQRRRFDWRIDGVDIRWLLIIIVPLGLAVGAGFARHPEAAVSFVQAVRGGISSSSIPAAPENIITGTASVIDGDTIEIHRVRIRLEAIDAPEGRQACIRSGVPERCGQLSAMHLDTLIGRRPVSCHAVGTDQYGRTLGICYQGDRDLNEQMVRDGHAVAYRHYSRRYVSAENEARRAGRGVWGTQFDMPWDWRRR